MAARRDVVYCALPAELAEELHDELRRFFGEQRIEVIVERREGERRRSQRDRRDRRAGVGPAPAALTERRALPPAAERHRDRIAFFVRLEPDALDAEDRATAALVRRIQAGEDRCFTELYERYYARVYGYLRIALDDQHEAEDAAQEVFARLFEALHLYADRGVPFRAWLFQIVRNESIDRLRRRARRAVVLSDQALAAVLERAPEEVFDRWLGERSGWRLVEGLPAGQRQVVVLCDLLGLSGPQAAALMGRSSDAIRQLHRRALATLRARADGGGPAQVREKATNEG